MTYPEQRQKSLNSLTIDQLNTKRQDVLLCIKSCKKDLLDMYNAQLNAVDALIAKYNQLKPGRPATDSEGEE